MGFISDSISATTVSGGTFYGDGSGLSGVGGPTIYSAGTVWSNGGVLNIA
jgi:hypothetical protein